ncbi:SDR family oxidoreductase [Pseudomonas veronii]|uniref:SDR family NAD(P)-dependent oxidoreductase n=1 Tax=Pseudomonas veronii TaxID=76761 RepID=UPI0021C03C60|nr:SDR family oxidoreductase [Pseudomonas veronii]MCT8962738.1 SDR family oxidoreductase [Pseudomonas veronii]
MSKEGYVQSGGKAVVIVTGGGSGIGAAVADRLAKTHHVVVCGRRQSSLEAVALRSGVDTAALDVTDYAAAQKLIENVVAKYGRLDGLVLNAGMVTSASVADMTLEDWNLQIDVNLTAPFVMAQAALPHLIKSQGAIVAVSSVGAIQTGPGLGAYASAKAGISQLMKCIAYENARFGVRANVVAPGWIRTEMGDGEMRALGISDSLEVAYSKVSEHVPQRRAGTAMEAAEVIVFLLSPAAAFVNGADYVVDGGSLIANSGMTYFDSQM